MSPCNKLIEIDKIISHLAPRTTPGTHVVFKKRFEYLRGIINKAEAALKSPETHQPFLINDNNCESFTHWLQIGKQWSAQAGTFMVNQAIYLVAYASAAVVVDLAVQSCLGR